MCIWYVLQFSPQALPCYKKIFIDKINFNESSFHTLLSIFHLYILTSKFVRKNYFWFIVKNHSIYSHFSLLCNAPRQKYSPIYKFIANCKKWVLWVLPIFFIFKSWYYHLFTYCIIGQWNQVVSINLINLIIVKHDWYHHWFFLIIIMLIDVKISLCNVRYCTHYYFIQGCEMCFCYGCETK